ncbi:MAG: radical SAM protein [Clostridia bacterium]|nr:radical SAM protein [Clostridia bacterium]
MKNKFLLIDPFCKNPKYESPNMKLGYCSSVLEKNGIETYIMDFLVPDIDKLKKLEEFAKLKEHFFKELNDIKKDYTYVYINCEYGLLKSCIDIANTLDKSNIIILGGTFVNYLYYSKQIEKISDELNCFNYISLGDPENDLFNIVNKVDTYEVARYNNTILYNSGLVKNLDSLPYPAWNKYAIDKYDGNLYLVASKSCRYNKCNFCDEKLIWGNEFRYRNYKEIVKEIIYNINNYKINSFFFWDASLASYPYINELCNEIIENNIKCKWTALVRAAEINNELAALMRKAGCYSIEIGIETLNDEILELMNKGVTVAKIVEAISILKKNDIKVEGSFLIGHFDDNKENILNTIKKSKELRLDYYRWHNLELSASFLLNNPNIINERWNELDLNYPNQFLHEIIGDHLCGYLDMHIVSKMGKNYPEKYPDFKIGNLTIQEIHDLTRKAIEGTEEIASIEGHNPYI